MVAGNRAVVIAEFMPKYYGLPYSSGVEIDCGEGPSPLSVAVADLDRHYGPGAVGAVGVRCVPGYDERYGVADRREKDE